MVDYAQGVFKTVAIAAETTFGTASVAAGRFLRRVSSDLNLNITPIETQEILPSQQMRDYRNGPRQVAGTLQGQLSPGSYQDIFQGIFRKNFAATAPVTGVTDSILVNATPGVSNVTLSSATAGWLTRGIKAGDVLRITGLTGGPVGLNGDNLRAISVTATLITMAPNAQAVAWAAAQTITVTVAGKKVFVPVTGHLESSYTIEHWFQDIGASEVFLGNRITQLAINVPASGFVTFNAGVTGVNQIRTGVQAYASAAAASTSVSVTSVDGKLLLGGVELAYITGLNLQIAPAVQTTPVVGSNILPDVFIGTLGVRGSFTALFPGSDTLTTDFLAETELQMMIYLTSSPSDSADFVSFYMARVKLAAANTNDSDRAIMRSFNFVALERVTGAGAGTQYDASTIVMQDSNAA